MKILKRPDPDKVFKDQYDTANLEVIGQDGTITMRNFDKNEYDVQVAKETLMSSGAKWDDIEALCGELFTKV